MHPNISQPVPDPFGPKPTNPDPADESVGESCGTNNQRDTPDNRSTTIHYPDVRESLPRRFRRLPEVRPDREGNTSYLVTACVEGRARVLNNTETLERMVEFLLESPSRYGWFGRRFVIMPDHVHLIAHRGVTAVALGSWIKAMKAFVGGLRRRTESPPNPKNARELTRMERLWRWQSGFHDHKFRSQESESRKWEYICLNPVRAGLVERPEDWPFGGEIFCDPVHGYIWVPRTSPLMDKGILIQGESRPDQH